jgi:hypothetical protein
MKIALTLPSPGGRGDFCITEGEGIFYVGARRRLARIFIEAAI